MPHLASSSLVRKRYLATPGRPADGDSSGDDQPQWAVPPTSIINQENAPSTCPQDSLMEERKQTPLLAEMQDTPKALTSDPDVNKHENKAQKEEIREEKCEGVIAAKQLPSVHFFPVMTDLDNMQIRLSESLSSEIPVSFCQITSAQNSGLTVSSAGPLTSKSTIRSLSRGDTSLAKQNSRKLTARSSQSEDVTKHLSVILEEVGQFTSSSLEDIKIADVNVKGLFVRLVNSSEDKEVGIGNHILQQNVNGHAVSLYRFPHNVTMQASSMVTVWAAAAEAKPKPPTDFVWEEQNRFRSSPDCTTILCKPNGEAIAWYTPIHWKQAWEKLETDIEFERCSVVIPTVKSHLFGWTVASESSINKEKQESAKRESSQCQIGHTCPALRREKEISPTVLPNRSPWCRSPYASPHPYCSLIESQDSDFSESRLGAQLKPQPAKPESAPGTKKKKSKSEKNRKKLNL